MYRAPGCLLTDPVFASSVSRFVCRVPLLSYHSGNLPWGQGLQTGFPPPPVFSLKPFDKSKSIKIKGRGVASGVQKAWTSLQLQGTGMEAKNPTKGLGWATSDTRRLYRPKQTGGLLNVEHFAQWAFPPCLLCSALTALSTVLARTLISPSTLCTQLAISTTSKGQEAYHHHPSAVGPRLPLEASSEKQAASLSLPASSRTSRELGPMAVPQ